MSFPFPQISDDTTNALGHTAKSLLSFMLCCNVVALLRFLHFILFDTDELLVCYSVPVLSDHWPALVCFFPCCKSNQCGWVQEWKLFPEWHSGTEDVRNLPSAPKPLLRRGELCFCKAFWDQSVIFVTDLLLIFGTFSKRTCHFISNLAVCWRGLLIELKQIKIL